MKNCITSNICFKHLDLDKRIKIEMGLNENKSFSVIAKNICKSPRTVSYEILRNRVVEYCTSWKIINRLCEKTLKPPYVCNCCPSRKGCRKTRYYYYAHDAQGKYENLKKDSRKGIDLTASEFKDLNDMVSNEIRKGHSFSMIVKNHKNEFPVSARTLYNYVESGYLDIINLDLPRKVRYKKRKKNNPNVPKKDTKIRINRTYEDFKDYVKEFNNNDFINNIVEMDTVEGTKGDSVLLTLLWRNSNFMLAIKMEDKTSDSVSNIFLYLKKLIGYEKFHELFPIILTDNGVEFSNPEVIENNGNHVYPTKLFYCDPGHSEQKGKIENNHEYIRRYIPKGNTFDNLSQDNINLMLNHINSIKRMSLEWNNPYSIIKNLLPKAIIDIFDIKEIEQENLIIKDDLFK